MSKQNFVEELLERFRYPNTDRWWMEYGSEPSDIGGVSHYYHLFCLNGSYCTVIRVTDAPNGREDSRRRIKLTRQLGAKVLGENRNCLDSRSGRDNIIADLRQFILEIEAEQLEIKFKYFSGGRIRLNGREEVRIRFDEKDGRFYDPDDCSSSSLFLSHREYLRRHLNDEDRR